MTELLLLVAALCVVALVVGSGAQDAADADGDWAEYHRIGRHLSWYALGAVVSLVGAAWSAIL